MPYFPMNTGTIESDIQNDAAHGTTAAAKRPVVPPASVQVKNRRKRYLDKHPEYFSSPDLELADPLLYDRLIRRFQTPKEREAEGRAKGFSGVLEADIMRSEAKLDALNNPDPNAMLSYSRGPNGEILAEDREDIPTTKEEGEKRWRWEMEMRFIKGADYSFDYTTVDDNEDYDDWNEEQERYFDEEEPEWIVEDDKKLEGETGIQDF
ncbi:hypothetical protein VTN02DRAFT_5594 [Thermoascus thermophilus]